MFDKRRANISPPVRVANTTSYFDTFEYVQRKPMGQALWKEIQRSLADQPDPHKRRLIPRRVILSTGRVVNMLKMHQPTQRALELIWHSDCTRHTAAHVALDWEVVSAEDLARLHEFIDSRLFRNGRLARIPDHYPVELPARWCSWWSPADDAYYATALYVNGRRTRGKELLHYADRASKVYGSRYCFHLEMRMLGKRALLNAGLDGLHSVLNFDFREFWEQNLVLRQAPGSSSVAALLGSYQYRMYLPRALRGRSPERIASILVRGSTDNFDNVHVRELYRRLHASVPWFAERLYRRLSQN
ncbi:MAG: hypothetical protein EON54_24655 [Alcaligenaceae bacterium]|nr:MAG: hypothetical protein EON54_24655 [Alcaligenaceae bacterium]